jgi:four helix bundle protein
MKEAGPTRPYDLAERTFLFAREVRRFVKALPRSESNLVDVPQLLRSSGSVGANYLEASDPLGKKDFRMRLRIARKETKESIYWLRLLDLGHDPTTCALHAELLQEASELLRILSAILRKTDGGGSA